MCLATWPGLTPSRPGALPSPLCHKVLNLWSSVGILIWWGFNFGLTPQRDVLFLQDLSSNKAISICKKWGECKHPRGCIYVWLYLNLLSGLPTGDVPGVGGEGSGSVPAGLALLPAQGNRPLPCPLLKQAFSAAAEGSREGRGQQKHKEYRHLWSSSILVLKDFHM